MKELIVAIDRHKKENQQTTEESKREDFKGVDEETTNLTHEVFNLIIKQDSMTPSSWKKVMITVIYNKGKPRKPKNLTNLFPSNALQTFLHDALQQTMRDSYQFPDQAGFIKKIQTTDRLLTYRPIASKNSEWRTDMWVAAIDFQKVFDISFNMMQKPFYQ